MWSGKASQRKSGLSWRLKVAYDIRHNQVIGDIEFQLLVRFLTNPNVDNLYQTLTWWAECVFPLEVLDTSLGLFITFNAGKHGAASKNFCISIIWATWQNKALWIRGHLYIIVMWSLQCLLMKQSGRLTTTYSASKVSIAWLNFITFIKHL